MVTNRDMRR